MCRCPLEPYQVLCIHVFSGRNIFIGDLPGHFFVLQGRGPSVRSPSSHSFPPFCAVLLMSLLRVRVPSSQVTVQYHCFHSPHSQSTEMEEEDKIFMNLITHCSVLVRIINKCTGKCCLWCQVNGGYCSNNYKYKQETQE